MKWSDFSRKNVHLSKAILHHKKPWLAALREEAVLRGHEGWDRPRACLSVCLSAPLLLQGGR